MCECLFGRETGKRHVGFGRSEGRLFGIFVFGWCKMLVLRCGYYLSRNGLLVWPFSTPRKLKISAAHGTVLHVCCALCKLFRRRKYYLWSVLRIFSCNWLTSSVPNGVRFPWSNVLVYLELLCSTTASHDILRILETFCGMVSSPLWLWTESALNIAAPSSFALGLGLLMMGLEMTRNCEFDGVVVTGRRLCLFPVDLSPLRTWS